MLFANVKHIFCFRLKSTDLSPVKEEVDELSLIDHKEIMSRITLKAEVFSISASQIFFILMSRDYPLTLNN